MHDTPQLGIVLTLWRTVAALPVRFRACALHCSPASTCMLNFAVHLCGRGAQVLNFAVHVLQFMSQHSFSRSFG